MFEIPGIVLALWAIGCSGSTDAAVPISDHDGPAHTGGTSSGGAGESGGAPSSGGFAGTHDGGRLDASAGGISGSGGASAVEAGTDGRAPNARGALVAYDLRAGEKKLYVFDPETGRAMSSEEIGTVRALVAGRAPGQAEHWFVFEQTGALDDGLTVHVRNLDPETGKFAELGSLERAPVIYGRPVILGTGGKSFVVYLSDAVTASASKADLALTVLDATDPSKPTLLGPANVPLPPGVKLGLVGDGDSLDVIVQGSAPCAVGASGAPECTVGAAHAVVNGAGITFGATTVIGSTGTDGNVDFVDDPSHHAAIVAFPPVQAVAKPTCGNTSRSTGTVQRFSTVTLVPGSGTSFAIESQRLRGAAYDACDDVAFLTDDSGDVAVWAVSLSAGGDVTKLCAGTAGGPLLYESSTRTLFRASASGGLEAYRVGMAGSSPTLTSRTLAELPSGVQFGAFAVRSPNEPACP